MFDTKITCPACNDNYVHFETPIYKDGKDNNEAWEGRGDAIEIPMWCENGNHKWKMIIGFNKGNTYLFTKVLVNENMLFTTEKN